MCGRWLRQARPASTRASLSFSGYFSRPLLTAIFSRTYLQYYLPNDIEKRNKDTSFYQTSTVRPETIQGMFALCCNSVCSESKLQTVWSGHDSTLPASRPAYHSTQTPDLSLPGQYSTYKCHYTTLTQC